MNHCYQRDMAHWAERRIVVPSKNCVFLLENKGITIVYPNSGPGARPESYRLRQVLVRGCKDCLQGICLSPEGALPLNLDWINCEQRW